MKDKWKDIPYDEVREELIRTSSLKFNRRMMHQFEHYLIERYCIHIRKDVVGAKAPWTDDEILQRYRFTNVRREHDRQTRWVIEHITSNPELCYEDKLLNCILFRLYNTSYTAELLGMPIPFLEAEDWNPECYWKSVKQAMIDNPDQKLFTGAFSMSGLKKGLVNYVLENHSTMVEMRPLWFMRKLLDDNAVKKIESCWSPEMVCSFLSRYKGIQEFFAYQIFVDFTYIDEFPYSENEYTIAGPGCQKGIEYLFNDTQELTYEECIFWLRDYLNSLPENDPLNPKEFFSDLPDYDQKWNVMCLENCLCEFSKYIRILTKTGKPRAIYKGGT